MLPVNKYVETDVLVIGGGIGGLTAAVSAREGGARVLVVEKANTKRSGSGATGNDHFLCYIPGKQGDLKTIQKEFEASMVGLCLDPLLSERFLLESFSVVKRWHEWGINMRLFDDWSFMGHAFPGKPRIFLKYDGHNQKEVLTKQALKSGADILNHHTVLDLLYNEDGVTGALALDLTTRTPSFTLIGARSVILATGCGNRLYPSSNSPGMLFNTGFCPSCTGAAPAQVWRIGGKLVNMELPNRHAGPRYFTRCGKSTWIGLYRYPDGRLLGPFVTKADREIGDITSDVWNTSFTDLMLNGQGPAYLDCTQTSKEDLEFMREGMVSEGLTSLIDYMESKGIDPAKHVIEFGQFEPHVIGRGVQIDVDGQTSVPGLYCAGDTVGNFRADIGGAAVYGWIAGQHAGQNYKSRDFVPPMQAEESDWAAERMAYYSSFHEHDGGPEWREANMALQQIMNDYAPSGPHRVRSESLLKAGISYLANLRKETEAQLYAPCSHTLMRAAEALDLMDIGEAVLHAARERKETRALHRRSDYTFTNPLLNNKFLMIWRENGQAKLEWRERYA